MRRSLLSLTALVVVALSSFASGCKATPTPIGNVSLLIAPSGNVPVPLGGQQLFTVTTSGSADTGIFWEVNGYLGGDAGNAACGCGTITEQTATSPGGLYTPPAIIPVPNTVSVAAVAHVNNNDVITVTVVLTSNISVAVSPASSDLILGQSQPLQLKPTVTGTTKQDVTWQVANGATGFGTISSSGLYTPPTSVTGALPVTVGVTATSVVDTTKSATVNIVLHSAMNVAVSPSPATVQTFGSQQFTATVTGGSSTVTWKVNGIFGGSPLTGTISLTGLYAAPNSVPTKTSGNASVMAPVTVTAVSQADSFFTGSSTVAVVAPNKGLQTAPTPLGVSGGNINDLGAGLCSGGTLGALVSLGGNQFILGTSSVFARNDLAQIGESIIQPSLTDAAVSCNSTGTAVVANLSQFYNLESGVLPIVDAAIAQSVPGQVDPAGNILQLGGTTSNGQPTSGAPHAGSGVLPAIGQLVAKSGRATGLTCSTIGTINGTFSVQYQKGYGNTAPSFPVVFTDLVEIGSGTFSATGDAGSLIVTQSTADPVALLIASFGTVTLANPVSDVLAALGNPMFVGSATTHPVAGCNIPAPQAAGVTSQASVSPEALLQATAVRNIHATELLSTAGVQALGVNSSSDDPSAVAIELFVTKDATPGSLPAQIDGLRTKIVKVGPSAGRGVLSLAESSTLESSAAPSPGTTLSEAEVAHARLVHSAHVDELMKLAGVQGVGVTSSADNPSEAAIMVYLIQGVPHAEIPAVIDGVRTRIKESGPFVVAAQ